MTADDWQDPSARALCRRPRRPPDRGQRRGDHELTGFVLLLNAHYEPVEFVLPPGRAKWDAVLTTGPARPDAPAHQAEDRGSRRPLPATSPQPLGVLHSR